MGLLGIPPPPPPSLTSYLNSPLPHSYLLFLSVLVTASQFCMVCVGLSRGYNTGLLGLTNKAWNVGIYICLEYWATSNGSYDLILLCVVNFMFFYFWILIYLFQFVHQWNMPCRVSWIPKPGKYVMIYCKQYLWSKSCFRTIKATMKMDTHLCYPWVHISMFRCKEEAINIITDITYCDERK